MSVEAVAWVKNLDYDACALGPFRVLLILAEHANSEGRRSWRSKRKIAQTIGVSERSVQRWFKDLQERGLIALGDQRYVDHLPSNQRPVVFDLMMFREREFWQVELPEELGETELLTGQPGETAAVAPGETAAVVSRNQVLEPVKTSIKTNHSTHAQTKEAGYAAAHRPATATLTTCPRGHQIIGHTPAGTPFCEVGCAIEDTRED